MSVRRQRATTSSEIMETDINIAIKKAKIRFRDNEKFYILKYSPCYFASSYPEIEKESGKEVYYQKWVFNNKRWRMEGK